MAEELKPSTRPKPHWKRSRFRPTDTFLWAKDLVYANVLQKMGEEVDKAVVGRVKLFRLFRAKLIVPQYTPTPHKDPLAPPIYPAEDVETVAAA